jgi:hypothetical protein
MVFSGLAKHSQNALRVYLLFEPQQLIAPRGALEAPQTDEVLAPPASPVLLTGVSSRPPAPIRKAISSISLSRATPEPLGAAPPAPTGAASVRDPEPVLRPAPEAFPEVLLELPVGRFVVCCVHKSPIVGLKTTTTAGRAPCYRLAIFHAARLQQADERQAPYAPPRLPDRLLHDRTSLLGGRIPDSEEGLGPGDPRRIPGALPRRGACRCRRGQADAVSTR